MSRSSTLGHRSPTPIPTSQLRDRTRKQGTPRVVTIGLAAMCLPIVIIGGYGVEIAPIDIIGPILLIALLVTPSGRDPNPPWQSTNAVLTTLWLAIIAALLAMTLAATTITGEAPWQQFGSFLFTFRPLAFLILGLTIARRRWASHSQVLRTLGTASAFSCISIAGYLLATGTTHHQWGSVEYAATTQFGEHLAGNLFTLPLYAKYGVNSLAVTYAVYGILSLAALFATRRQIQGQRTVAQSLHLLWLSGGVLAAIYLCVTSDSRQAILLLGATLALAFLTFILKKIALASHSLVIGAIVVLILGVTPFAVREVLSVANQLGGFDVWAAGRVDIVTSELAQLNEHPILGTGFLDNGSSPSNAHNLILNLAIKFGVPGAAFYLVCLLIPTRPAIKRLLSGHAPWAVLVTDLGWILLIFAVGIVSNSLDVVTASGPLLILLGLHATIPEP